MADIQRDQHLLPTPPMHNHLGQQLQRTPSSTSDQDAIFSAMENGSSMAQDWMPSSAEYNLSSLGFDNMFQFNGQVDPFPIDHTEFASNDFGFPPGMSAIFDGSVGTSLEATGLETNGRIMDNFQAHGDSNESSNANSVADLANSNDTSLEQNDLGLNMALKPSFMNRFKSSPSALARQQQSQFQEQGFNAQMDMSPSDVAQSQLFHSSLQTQAQDSHSHQGQQHTTFGFPHENVQSFSSFPQHQQVLQQPPLDEDMMSSHNQFMQNSPMSLANGTLQQQQQQQQQMMKQQQQKQFEDMLFHQQQQQQMGDTKGHFRHSSSPNFTDMIQENLRSRAKHQVSMHLQDSHSRPSIHPTSVHPFSIAPMSGKSAPTQKLTKRPSDLHVDISGRSSSFRLSGDVRTGDFRFGNDIRDGSISAIGSAPLSPTASTASLQAPPTPAFFSPAFGDALSSPSLGLYHNSPFVHPDRNRASMQTDSSIGSFMDIHASSASSPSSLGSLNDVGHRMFRNSTDSMTPVDTIMPMDINFANMAGDMNYLDHQDLSLSSASLPGQGSFCPSPDHIDPHNVEVKPSFFSQYQEEQIKMELMTSPEMDSNSNSVFNSAPEVPKTQSQPVPQPKTARKRRSNEAVACSPSVSSVSNSSSPPRNPRSRTISTTSSVVDEKEDLTHNFGPAASMRPIMLTHDLKPPSAKAMRTIIKSFLSSKTPTAGGEKSVLILTSKVAQKSYGTEKRFLCPPPTTMLLGGNWWSAPEIGRLSPTSTTSSSDDNLGPVPPKMVVSICGEAGSQLGTIDWTATKEDGVAPIVSGKCVSKQLYINDADEKRKKVEVLVKFMMAGDLELGTFASKPIKVISKPSKKRQSIKNMELCIHHGTTISLFNRIRSQTVSTKYLGVSTTSQPSAHAPWNYGNNNLRDWPNVEPSSESSANPVNADGGTCFVARTGSWDPFVVWIVSPGKNRTETLEEHSQRHPGFPPPPAIAINSPPSNGPQTPIHYNQPIVLQCLSTGLVSPVMVIRKVDKGSMVLGGGSAGHSSAEYDQDPVGDPVSQLHKVAFQITGQPPPTAPFSHAKLQQGTYLACLGDVVGMQRANEGKMFLQDPSGSPPSSAKQTLDSLGPAYSMDMVPEIPESNIPEALMSAWSAAHDRAMEIGPCGEKSMVTTADGQKIERKRRVSSSAVIKSAGATKATALKNRRRVNSMSVTQAEAQRIRASAQAANNQAQQAGVHAYVKASLASLPVDSAKEKKETAKVLAQQQQRRSSSVWTEDVTDAAVWTIVGTDCAQYNFCTPGGPESMSLPRSPVTPSPKVTEVILNGQNNTPSGKSIPVNGHHYSGNGHSKALQPNGSHHHHHHSHSHHHHQHHHNGYGGHLPNRIMTLKGHGFQRDLTVWFGTIKAPVTEYQSSETMIAQVPEEVSLGSSFYFTKDDDEDEENEEDEDDTLDKSEEAGSSPSVKFESLTPTLSSSTTLSSLATATNNAHRFHQKSKSLTSLPFMSSASPVSSSPSSGSTAASSPEDRFKRKRVKGQFESDCVPILLVRKDGVIFRSGHSISLG
ncbi:hypothetical protein BGZ82_007458 [Podila clonocystis]|nr:hypothetical protein BGZ82_007458 [Podila clonocystis]